MHGYNETLPRNFKTNSNTELRRMRFNLVTNHWKTDSEFMHGYTLGLLHGEGHEVLYANHNVYVNEGSPAEVTSIQTFYEKQYLEINKAITYIRFKIK